MKVVSITVCDDDGAETTLTGVKAEQFLSAVTAFTAGKVKVKDPSPQQSVTPAHTGEQT